MTDPDLDTQDISFAPVLALPGAETRRCADIEAALAVP
jgi:hypothetical protein